MEKLAIKGGKPVRTKLFREIKSMRYGEEELEQLRQVLSGVTLAYFQGSKVKDFEKEFAELLGVKYCITTSSGSAAIHAALGVVGIGPGDEVITTPVTDMGSIIDILYQNAIPIFADVNLDTYNLDSFDVEKKITDKTEVILAVHLFSQSCNIDRIMQIAKQKGLYVIEDCAQAYLATYKGRLNGTIGHLGCFSLQDSKHIGTGDGGMLVINDDRFAERAPLFRDKCYFRDGRIRNPLFLAPNYRMTALQGAVALAQLKKLPWIVQKR